MNAGTTTVKHAKVIQLPTEGYLRSTQNQDACTLNVSANLTGKLQGKSKNKPEIRERRTRSSDLNSRPSLAAASKKGMQLKNSKVNNKSMPKADGNDSSTARANKNN